MATKKIVHVVSFSGGRTSAYLVHLMEQLRKNEGCEVVYIFLDTGAEHPLTYKFIRDIVKHWGINLICLRVKITELGQGNEYEVVPVEDLKWDMTTFTDLCTIYGTPYNAGAHCTREMKRRTYDRYCKRIFGTAGEDFITWLGMRADEPKRLKPRKGVRYLAEISDYEKSDILDWWRLQPFDLQIPEHLGNCVFCVKKNVKKIAIAMRDEPALLEDWRTATEWEHVRILPDRQLPSEMMYRGPHSIETIGAAFANESRDDLYRSMKFSGGEETGSCTESCEVFNDDDD